MKNRYFLAALPLLLACSSKSSSPAAAQATDDAAAPPVMWDAKRCVVAPDWVAPQAVCVRTLSATVVDEMAVPISNLVTTACGDGCSFGRTDAAGRTSMSVHRYMTKPALMLHGHSKYASYYILLEPDGDVDKGLQTLPTMPVAGLTIPEDGLAHDITAGDVTISLPAGGSVLIDKTELIEVPEQQFRSLAVPVAKAPPFVDPALKITALYALTPFATKLAPGVALSVANTAMLPNGAAVEFFIQGTDVKDKFGPFGRFNKIAEGHVSADGTKITTDAGQSITELTWLGIRVKQ